MSGLQTYLDTLSAQACPGGGWGYAPGQGAHLEPTCLALLALAATEPEDRDRHRQLVNSGRAFLKGCRSPDGLYRLPRGRPQAVWATALVLLTETVLGAPEAEVQAAAAALLGMRGRDVSTNDSDINDIDACIVGWPWAENNFAWVEPTAWACLALRRAGQGGHDRVQQGQRLLLDRALEEGGINYGNRRILGIALEPIPGPTALMLLASQGLPEHPRITAAVQYLLREIRNPRGNPKSEAGAEPVSDFGFRSSDFFHDLEHLCWARLALDLYQHHDGVREVLPELDRRIRAAHQARPATSWVRPAPVRDALTILALSAGQANPFRLPARADTAPVLTPRPFLPHRPGLAARIKSWYEGMKVEAVNLLQQPEPLTSVHIAPAADYNADLAGVVCRQYEHFRARVPLAGKRVVLKPNLVEYHRDKVINTHPNVVAAAIELCRREGAAEVLVAEGPGHWRNVEYLVSASGLGDVLRHYQVPFVDLNHDEPVKRLNLGRLTGLEYLYLTRTIATADVVISLPKLKTHHWAVATLSLKNLFGTLPGICYGWPKNELHWRGIDNSIVDIALTRHARPRHRGRHHRHGRRRPAQRPAQTDGPAHHGPRPRRRRRHLLPAHAARSPPGSVPGAGPAQEAGPAGGKADPAARRDDRQPGSTLRHRAAFPGAENGETARQRGVVGLLDIEPQRHRDTEKANTGGKEELGLFFRRAAG